MLTFFFITPYTNSNESKLGGSEYLDALANDGSIALSWRL